MLRRSIGPSGPQVSQLSYGSMRLPEWSPSVCADWLCRLHDSGIDTHHSSHEYDSHALYLRGLTQARRTGRTFAHIAKLSSPSFDSSRFDARRFAELVDNELASLGSETVTNVQWLVRTPDAQDDPSRLAVLVDQHEEITECFETLIAAGKVETFSVFPYSESFAHAALATLPSVALAAYLNLGEREYTQFLELYDSFIAIRPLGGGQLGLDPLGALEFSLLHPTVSTSVVSVNSEEHLTAALAAVANLAPDRNRFEDLLAELA